MQSLQDLGTPYSPYLHLVLVPQARLPFGQLPLRAQADFEQGSIVGRSDARRFRMLNDADTRLRRCANSSVVNMLHVGRCSWLPSPSDLVSGASELRVQMIQTCRQHLTLGFLTRQHTSYNQRTNTLCNKRPSQLRVPQRCRPHVM